MPPTPPNPPRSGHPGKPPAREVEVDVDETTPSAQGADSSRTPHSYGQSAPMPDDESTATVVRQVRQPDNAGDGQGEDDPRETIEDLAGEPVREEGEDEPIA